MTLKQYLTIMGLASILCWTALGVVLVNVNPFEAALLSFVFFYVSLFFSLLGTLSIILFVLYRLISQERQPMFRYVQRSFRDAFFISVSLVILLFLQGQEWLNIWSFTFFLLILVFALSFKLSMRRNSLV